MSRSSSSQSRSSRPGRTGSRAAAPRPAGGRLVATGGRALPLIATTLGSDARAGMARTTLEQRFRNPHDEALAVTYLLPLPAEGAVSGFAFRIGERRVTGEVQGRAAARETFARALAGGHTAAILESERDTVFTQEIGNIPAGAEVVVEIVIDQRLRWLPGGEWEWRFPTVVAPRYQGAEGRVHDAERIEVEVSDAPLAVRGELALLIRDALSEDGTPSSPSHRIHVERDEAPETGGAARGIRVAATELALDRDIVVRWPVARSAIGLALDTGRPAERNAAPADAGAACLPSDSAYGLLAIMPPRSVAETSRFPRDLVLLLDTSGSMAGPSIEVARRVSAALIDMLNERDTLELIAFSSRPERWRGSAVAATDEAKGDALEWLARREASGGTEMRAGIAAALQGIRSDAARQVVLLTDGLVGFETEIVADLLRELPAGSHLHTVGIGGAPNRSLTAAAARAGRGIEVLADARAEEPEDAVRRLIEATSVPLLADVVVSGTALLDHAPARILDLHGAGPALVSVKLRPGGGELVVHGRTPSGSWRELVQVPPLSCGAGNPALAALFARETVADLEMRCAAGEDRAGLDLEIEATGIAFQIATRLTSWVAVSEEATVDPTQPFRREIMPHNLPAGLSAEGLGIAPSLEMACFHKAMTLPERRSALTGRGGRGRLEWFREYRPSGSLDQDPGPDVFVQFSKLGRGAPRSRPPRHERRGGRKFRGRITLLTRDALIVEIDIQADALWRPREVDVYWKNGRCLDAEVIAGESTAPRGVARGTTVRLALRLGELVDPADPPAGIEVFDGLMSITIEIRGA